MQPPTSLFRNLYDTSPDPHDMEQRRTAVPRWTAFSRRVTKTCWEHQHVLLLWALLGIPGMSGIFSCL